MIIFTDVGGTKQRRGMNSNSNQLPTLDVDEQKKKKFQQILEQTSVDLSKSNSLSLS